MTVNIGLIKAAARAWKLHDLSDESRSRLEQAGVLDYHKELNGLDRGSDNIFEKVNKRLKAMHPRGVLTEEYLPGTSGGKSILVGTGTRISMHNHEFEAAPQLHITYGDKLNYQKLNKRSIATKPLIEEVLNKPSPMHGDFTRAILRRHELDEASAATHRANGALKTLGKLVSPGGKYHNQWAAMDHWPKVYTLQDWVTNRGYRGHGDIYSHTNAQILVRESGNLAGAPSSVRAGFKALRFHPNKKIHMTNDVHQALYDLNEANPDRSWDRHIADLPIPDSDLITEGKLMHESGLSYGTQVRKSREKSLGNKMLAKTVAMRKAYKDTLFPRMRRFEHLYHFITGK